MHDAGPAATRVSYHEAGHLVVAHLLGCGLGGASIVPGAVDGAGRTLGGWALFRPDPTRGDGPDVEVLVALAGPAAERRRRGLPPPDWGQLDASDRDLVARNAAKDARPDRVAPLVRYADRLLADNWHLVEAVADALLARRTLDGPAIDRAIDRALWSR